MRRSTSTTCGAALALALSGCAASRAIAPLERGTAALTASVGGPMFAFGGTPLPTPISTVGVAYGATERTTVHASLHPTGLALFGTFAADVGASTQFLAPEGARPRLMGDLTVIGAGGDVAEGSPEGGVRVFARPNVTASWDWGKNGRSTVYTSLGGFVQPYPGPNALGTIAVGNLWALGPHHLTTQVEWLAPYASSEPAAPYYYAPGDLGAISVQIGLGVRAVGAK